MECENWQRVREKERGQRVREKTSYSIILQTVDCFQKVTVATFATTVTIINIVKHLRRVTGSFC